MTVERGMQALQLIGFELQELMGHANIATTKRYMHAFDEDKLEAVEAVGKVLGARNS